MRGLDPRIHRKNGPSKKMDCRVKPGNDGVDGSDPTAASRDREFAVAAVRHQHAAGIVGDAEFGLHRRHHRLRRDAAGPEHRDLVGVSPEPHRRSPASSGRRSRSARACRYGPARRVIAVRWRAAFVVAVNYACGYFHTNTRVETSYDVVKIEVRKGGQAFQYDTHVEGSVLSEVGKQVAIDPVGHERERIIFLEGTTVK